jgi:hypothetical protein
MKEPSRGNELWEVALRGPYDTRTKMSLGLGRILPSYVWDTYNSSNLLETSLDEYVVVGDNPCAGPG